MLDSTGNARLFVGSTVTLTLGLIDRKHDGLVDLGSVLVGGVEDRQPGNLKAERAIRQYANLAKTVLEGCQFTSNVLGKVVYHCDFSW